MKKSNKIFRLSAFVLLLSSFIFTTTSIVSADEKKAEVATDADKTKGDKKDGEEPECE